MRYALLCLALVGCASQVPNDWRKADASPGDLDKDRGQCRAQALSIPPQHNVNEVVTQVYRACMEGKGWKDVAH